MPICDQCGNDYADTFKVTRHNRSWTFDCFECAIQLLAPVCTHCHCRVIGHGVEKAGEIGLAIEKALQARRPVVIDVVTDIDALAPLAVS